MRIFVTNNNEIIHYGQRHQSPQSGACRKEENEQVVGRTTWLCADYCFKVVYQRLSASDEDVYKDCEATGSGDRRVAEQEVCCINIECRYHNPTY